MVLEETKSKIDLEKFKEAIKDLTLQDILPIVVATVNSFRELGEFVIATGHLQKKSQKAYEVIEQLGEEPQAFLAVLVDKIPEEKLKPLVELTLEMSMLQLKLKDFAKSTAEEKIAMGEQLKELSLKINKLLEEMKK